MTGVGLFVAKRCLEVHARTQSKRICVQHRFVIAQHLVAITICTVGCFGLWCESREGVRPDSVRTTCTRRRVETGHVRRRIYRVLVFVDEVRLGIVFLLCKTLTKKPKKQW